MQDCFLQYSTCAQTALRPTALKHKHPSSVNFGITLLLWVNGNLLLPWIGSVALDSLCVLMVSACICSKQVPDPVQLLHSLAGTGGWPLAARTVPQVFQGSPSASPRILCHMATIPRRVWSILRPATHTPARHHTRCLLFHHNESENSCTHNPLL